MKKRILSSIVFGGVLISQAAMAGMIDAETVNGAAPADDQLVGNEFAALGVIFSPGTASSNGKSLGLHYEAVGGIRGSDTFGFVSDVLGQNVLDVGRTPADNAQLGSHFLRMGSAFFDGDFDRNLPFLTMDFIIAPTSPVTVEVWDLDGTQSANSEGVRIDAVDTQGKVLASLDSGVLTQNNTQSLDGQALTYTFFGWNGLDLAAIDRLEFYFSGSKARGLGIGFDNIETGVDPVALAAFLQQQSAGSNGTNNVAEAPLPGTLPLAGAALVLGGWFARRRKARS
jgi:hypothetical protein